MTSGIETGSLVEVRGQRWRLMRAQRFDACAVLSLEGRDRSNAMERLVVIDPFDRPRPIAPVALQRRARHIVIGRAVAAAHGTNPADGLWTAAAARIDLHAYQLEPALAAIGGATRLLLADAVGLGKTIQAGLLLSELHHRGWIERALIVCPAGLREIWQQELRDRFGIDAAIFDQQTIADRVASCPRGVNPWLADRIAIVSIDFVKRDEIMAALDAVAIDLLIADEAHHLCPGTDRGAAVARLAARSVWCVLVSATPHSGDRAAFEYLTAVGRHADDVVLFRRGRRDVGLPQARRVHFLPVSPSPEEQRLFAAVERYAAAIWCDRGRIDGAARLVAITIARRAASSIEAVAATLRRRRALLGHAAPDPQQPPLPWEDIDEADGDEANAIIAAPGLENPAEERDALDSLIALTSSCRARSKIDRLLRLLHRLGEPVIVFTEYRDTLEAITALLRSGRRVMSIHGAMPHAARRAAVAAFNSGECDVLVATDAAGEGLNLQQCCRLVIDIELPWNPLRLEQRIGRVDRLGQRRVVHAIRLFHRDSIEQQVLDRLALRRRQAEHDLSRAIPESDVAAAVFTGQAIAAPDDNPLHGTSITAATAEARRLARQRRFPVGSAGPERCWTRPKRSGTRRMFVLHRETWGNVHGVAVGSRAGAHLVTFGHQPRSSREWRAAIEKVRDRLPPHLPAGSAARHRIGVRIAAIRQWLCRYQRREQQHSLFDDRSDAIRIERERAAELIEGAFARIERALEPADQAHTQIEIVAAWPERWS